jgi:hypothetical protein
MIYLGLSSQVESEILSKQTSVLKESNLIKNEILDCWKEITYFKLGEINTFGGVNCLPESIKGYEISSYELLDCGGTSSTVGIFSDCKMVTSYFIHVLDSSGKKCLGQLKICFGD